ncbi:MAG TPA: hypothetical protein VM051_00705 [Usitatibacter sp.]|nr:hypothetical protein [Usitatibacter sp.]
MGIRTFVFAALVAVALAASATPQRRNATDLWVDPAELGWGLNIFHQGDTLFASLFVYGSDGQPKWYTGSALTGGSDVFQGELTEAAGPWFGGPFDSARVSRRTVGNMTFRIDENFATVDYTIDGVHVTRRITRFTFARTSLDGTYVGFRYERQSGGVQVRHDENMSITDDGANVTLVALTNTNIGCTWTGTHGQDGQYEHVAGTYTCPDDAGQWSMKVDPTTEGFTGLFSGGDMQSGRIGAARRDASRMLGNGYRNALWFPADEGGWGLNTIEQGDTLFATLFVYDAQRRPRWYSGSNLQRSGMSGDTVTYTGALVESTGPYYGTAFNPASVTRRTVGGMTLTTRADGSATLSYSVDGVAVEKRVARFTFRKNNFSGAYLGHLAADNSSGYESATINIDDSGSNFIMQSVTAGSGTCSYLAPMSQMGHIRLMSGTFSCTSGRSGNFTMSNATISDNGFTARLQMDPSFSGRMEGVRQGTLGNWP